MLFNSAAPNPGYPDIEKLILRGARELEKAEAEFGDIDEVSDQNLLDGLFYPEALKVRDKAIRQGWISEDDKDAWRKFAEDEGLFVSRWAKKGFPRILLNERQVHQFIVSSINKDSIEGINPPWDHFVIQFPKNVLTVINNGKADTVERILVRIPDDTSRLRKQMNDVLSKLKETTLAELPMKWRIAWDSFGDRQGYITDTVENLLQYSMTEGNKDLTHLPEIERKSGAMMTHACIRIVFCTVIEMMMNRGHFNHSTEKHNSDWRKKHQRKAYPFMPVSNKYVFTKAIPVSYKETVRDYLGGNANSPSVRFLVRGHYRWQAHGPKMSLRKWIYVSPFWKGRENEEIAVRVHELK